jgi:hypothetical protein
LRAALSAFRAHCEAAICCVSDAFDKATGIFDVKRFHSERLHNHFRNIPPEECRADYFAKSGIPALDDEGNKTAEHSQHVSHFTICAPRQSRLTAMEMQIESHGNADLCRTRPLAQFLDN